jgi:peptide/nickel transport system substrate-binding protein
MHAPLRAVDPVISTAYILRDYGYMVYDTLLAQDANHKVQPQMASWAVSPDGKTYTFTLRDGLKWHDETPVTAADCVASVERWSKLDKMGQLMNTMLTSMKVVNDKQFTMTFNTKTDIALRALGKPSGLAAFMMPKKVAETPIGQPITSTIGSGPFKFVTAEYKPGVQAVFEKFKDYVPRSEPASGLAGGKVVKVDRVKWLAMPDAMTALSALQSGEVDFMEAIPLDLLPTVQGNPDIVLKSYKEQGSQNLARLNWSQPPFDNLKIRQAAMLAMGQKEVLEAQVGNAKYYRTCAAVLGCNSPYADTSDADMVLTAQPDKAKALLKEAGYNGTPIVVLQATDVPSLAPVPIVLAAQLRKAGFNVQLQSMDWQSVLSRRASKAPVSQGGWNIFTTTNVFPDVMDPMGFIGVAANGPNAWFGWPDVPKIEEDRAKMARTGDPVEMKALAKDLQKQVVENVVMIPLGEFDQITGERKNLVGQIDAAAPVFWNVSKTGS